MGTQGTAAATRLLRDLEFEPVNPDRMRRANRSYRLQDLGDGKGYRTGLPPQFVHANGLEQGDEPTVLFNHNGVVILDYSGGVSDGSE